MIKAGDYEVAEEAEVKELTKKYKLRFGGMHSEGEFYSPDVKVDGQTVPRKDVVKWRGIPVTGGDDPETLHKRWKGISEEVPGLKCPYCNSQAFKTDHPNIAVCGAAPGWYMFYRRIDQDVQAKAKLVIRNGELVEETDSSKEADVL